MTLNFFRKKEERERELSYTELLSYGGAKTILDAEELAPYSFSKKELAVIFGLRSLGLGGFPASAPPRRLPKMGLALIEEVSLAGVPKPLREKLLEDLDFARKSGIFLTRFMEDVGEYHILYVGKDRTRKEWKEGIELPDQRFRLSSAPAATIPIGEYLFWAYTTATSLDDRLADLSEWTDIPLGEQKSLLKSILLFMRKDYARRLPDYEKEAEDIDIQPPFVCWETKTGRHWKTI
ncbi:hypothetical protein IKF26_01985 [Candidatus Saccharibacteria bacterium]|nr:hypothetical protein [Candidatus Saccharibacteria bacterium]